MSRTKALKLTKLCASFRMSVEKYRCNVDKKGQQSIVDTAIDTFIRKYRRYRHRYIKSIVDNIDIYITNPAASHAITTPKNHASSHGSKPINRSMLAANRCFCIMYVGREMFDNLNCQIQQVRLPKKVIEYKLRAFNSITLVSRQKRVQILVRK